MKPISGQPQPHPLTFPNNAAPGSHVSLIESELGLPVVSLPRCITFFIYRLKQILLNYQIASRKARELSVCLTTNIT